MIAAELRQELDSEFCFPYYSIDASNRKEKGRRRAWKLPTWPFITGATGAEVSFYRSIIQVISWFVKIDLKHVYCSYSHTQKLQSSFL